MSSTSFGALYSALEERFKRQVESDRNTWNSVIYLPSIPPVGPADFVFVGMEPSIGRWAASPAEAEKKIGLGFKDFSFSIEDFILHYAIKRCLCTHGAQYHITNLSKGAMKVDEAEKWRFERYEEWYLLFRDEFDLVTNQQTRVVAIGNAARKFLNNKGFKDKLGRAPDFIMHYSSRAGKYRHAPVVGHEPAFREFANSIGIKDVLEAANAVIGQCHMQDQLAMAILKRLHRRTDLTQSQKELLFGYQRAFTEIGNQFKLLSR